MIEVYLYAARFLLAAGHTDAALGYLALALGECNKTEMDKLERRDHVLRALSYGRRIES